MLKTLAGIKTANPNRHKRNNLPPVTENSALVTVFLQQISTEKIPVEKKMQSQGS